MVELKETCRFMCSEDYKDRFCAEYLQLKERHRRLKAYINRIIAAQLKGLPEPKHDCPLSLLNAQLNHMEVYMNVLELRAVIEKIDLDVCEELIASSAPDQNILSQSIDAINCVNLEH